MSSENLPTRREILKTLGAAGAGLVALGAIGRTGFAAEAGERPQPFTLPKLAYAFDALEPHFDAQTMEIHVTKHHQAYINNANAALKDYPKLQSLTGEQLLQRLPEVPEKIRVVVRNNVGGHVNHSFFWQVLAPGAAGAPSGALRVALDGAFGSVDAFKKAFADAAAKRFGSGWAWLSAKGGSLVVHSTANQDSPLSEGARPLLGLDVWEHAYYLKHQNRRVDYIAAFWNVVNWRQVEANYATSSKA
jgi:Fe-Mn family superoxide dismutase